MNLLKSKKVADKTIGLFREGKYFYVKENLKNTTNEKDFQFNPYGKPSRYRKNSLKEGEALFNRVVNDEYMNTVKSVKEEVPRSVLRFDIPKPIVKLNSPTTNNASELGDTNAIAETPNDEVEVSNTNEPTMDDDTNDEMSADTPEDETDAADKSQEDGDDFEKLSGKLAYELRNDDSEDAGQNAKYALNMVISAIDVNKLSDDDKEDIQAKLDKKFESKNEGYTPMVVKEAKDDTSNLDLEKFANRTLNMATDMATKLIFEQTVEMSIKEHIKINKVKLKQNLKALFDGDAKMASDLAKAIGDTIIPTKKETPMKEGFSIEDMLSKDFLK